MAAREIVNGAFQDALGNPLAFGSLDWRLNTDATTSSNVQIMAERAVTVPLDGNGNVAGTVSIWPNDQLTPTTTVYFIKAYSAVGQLVWQQQLTIPSGVGPYNLFFERDFLLQEDGNSLFILEDGSGDILLES